MNTKQRKQVASWIGGSAFIGLMLIFHKEILENWDVLRWVCLALIIVAVTIFQPKGGYQKDPELINRTITNHPWLKVWYIVYCIVLALFIYNSLSTGRDLF